MANNGRNNDLTKIVQTIKDMATTLLINWTLEGTTESQGLVEFRRNKLMQLRQGSMSVGEYTS